MANVQHIFYGVSPPAGNPPDVGLHYIDTDARISYVSVGTSDPSDWVKSGSSGGINEYWFQVAIPGQTVDIPDDADVVHIERTSPDAWAGELRVDLPLVATRTKHNMLIHFYGVFEGTTAIAAVDRTVSVYTSGTDELYNRDELDTGGYFLFSQNAVELLDFAADTSENLWYFKEISSEGDIDVTYIP